MNRSALFAVSCISLVTTSMVFAIRGGIEGEMSAAFHLKKEDIGLIWGPAFWGFTVAIFVCGFLVDILGMRLLHALSALGYIVGVGLVLVAPPPEVEQVTEIFAHRGTVMLYVGFLLMGLSQGVVEGVINPLVATMYSDQKAHKLNVLHAWWPGGLIIGGLSAYGLTQAGVTDWRIKLGLILIPAATYLVWSLSLKYPKTERVSSGVSTGRMAKEALRPTFLFLFACMWLTAATEVGPNQWFPTIMKELAKIEGILFLVYTAGLMFVLRSFAGPIVHKISPPIILLVSAILSALGLYWLGSLQVGAPLPVAFAAATVFGVGVTFFWPTMLAVASEQFPRGGSLLMNLVGGAGMLSVAIALPQIGRYLDQAGEAKLSPGEALQKVAVLPLILIVAFGAMVVYFKVRGGYKPQKIEQE